MVIKLDTLGYVFIAVALFFISKWALVGFGTACIIIEEAVTWHSLRTPSN